MNEALLRTSKTWLISMPVIAAQLVLATAAESGSLVADDRFALNLPLVRDLIIVTPCGCMPPSLETGLSTCRRCT
jgi:hypothetical protein